MGIVVDRWDGPELERAQEIAPFVDQRHALVEQFGPWGGDALDDIFWLLYKARPELADMTDVENSRIVGHVLVSLLARNATVQRLRLSTMRDLVGAALAAAKLAPQLAQAVEDAHDGTEALEAASASEAGDDEQRRVVAEQASDAAEAALEEMETAVGVVADQAEHQTQSAEAWGLGGGGLQRLSVAERLELAETFDADRVRQITDLFGRLRTTMFAERPEMRDEGVEPVDVELGGTLERMVGAELLSMLCDELFFARVADSALLQYAVRGEEPMSRGGIVLCVDGSASMAMPLQGYTREMWASALKLHLLHAAVRENRPMHVIDFGAANELQYQRYVDPGERTPQKLLEAASVWWGWGTDFGRPLRTAVQVLADENDYTSDVVFVSDGECEASKRTCETYRRACRIRNVRTWGVQLAPRAGGMRAFCDHIFSITDLTSGRELGALLNAVQSRA
jgi:uncharacterized protein with von Willebrand factor type A (vWA) domain